MKRWPSASTSTAPFAAQRFAEQESVLGQHRRVELHELEVGEPRAGAKSHGHAVTGGAGRVRRALPERRGAARGDERRPRLDRPPIGDDPGATTVPRPRSRAPSPLRRRECAGARAHGRRARGGSPCRSRHRRRGARGGASARLRAPARDRTARRAQRRSATRAGASPTSARTALSRHRPRPARIVSSACSSGLSSITSRRGHAALREVAGGRAQRPLREQQHVRFVAHAERGVQAGDASADDGEIAACDRCP